MTEIPIVCVLEAIPADKRADHEASFEVIFGQVQAITELSDGYRFVFPVHTLVDVAQYVSLERLCCPFFDFTLHIAPQADALHLDLTGGEGVKTFLQESFNIA